MCTNYSDLSERVIKCKYLVGIRPVLSYKQIINAGRRKLFSTLFGNGVPNMHIFFTIDSRSLFRRKKFEAQFVNCIA